MSVAFGFGRDNVGRHSEYPAVGTGQVRQNHSAPMKTLSAKRASSAVTESRGRQESVLRTTSTDLKELWKEKGKEVPRCLWATESQMVSFFSFFWFAPNSP